jgi:hypothetical protein
MESEFISAARGVQEAMGCYYLVKELGMNMQLPMKLRMDNQAAITCIMNEASSSKTKHVKVSMLHTAHMFLSYLEESRSDRSLWCPSQRPTIFKSCRNTCKSDRI